VARGAVSRRNTVGLALLLLAVLSLPAQAGVSVVGGLCRERTVESGKAYKGVIFISNSDDTPAEAKVYQTDYVFFRDGKSVYGEPGKAPRSNAGWITFSPPRLVIPAKRTVPVDYSIKVPAEKPLKGTYWSMIMVEGVSKSSPESIQAEEGKAKLGITNVIRYGIQMVTHIGDTGTRKLKFLETKLLREDGKRIFQVDIENTGQRWLRPFLWVELYDGDGRYVGRFEGRRARTFPGTSVRRRIDLSAPPKGTYKALLVADGGEDAVFGVSYTLKLEGEQTAP